MPEFRGKRKGKFSKMVKRTLGGSDTTHVIEGFVKMERLRRLAGIEEGGRKGVGGVFSFTILSS